MWFLGKSGKKNSCLHLPHPHWWPPHQRCLPLSVRVFQYVCVCVFSHVWLCATSGIVAGQAPLSMGFSRQGYWSGLPCPPPGSLPVPWTEPTSPAFVGDSLQLAPPGKPNMSLLFKWKYFTLVISECFSRIFRGKGRWTPRRLGAKWRAGGSKDKCLLCECPGGQGPCVVTWPSLSDAAPKPWAWAGQRSDRQATEGSSLHESLPGPMGFDLWVQPVVLNLPAFGY